MHEYSLMSALFEQLEVEARRHHATRVSRVVVKLGERAGVDRELFERAFELFRERTICDGAELIVEAVPEAWACSRCGAPIERGAPLRCAKCELPARLVTGDELVLQRVEMEVQDV